MAGYKKMKQPERMVAFNVRYIIYLLVLVVSLWGDIYLLSHEDRLSWLLSVMVVVAVFLLCADAVFYVFTKNEISLVHFWGYKETVPWVRVNSVIKYNFWSSIRELPRYEIFYNRVRKGKTIRTRDSLPLTPRIKRCFRTYYHGSVLGEDSKRKKGERNE